MRNLSKITLTLLLLFSLFLLPAAIPADDNPSAGYNNYQALTNALKQVAGQNTKITKLTSIGKTLKGRDLWMLRVSGVKGPSPFEKQALLICGNLEGDHVIGSEVALGIAKYRQR